MVAPYQIHEWTNTLKHKSHTQKNSTWAHTRTQHVQNQMWEKESAALRTAVQSINPGEPGQLTSAQVLHLLACRVLQRCVYSVHSPAIFPLSFSLSLTRPQKSSTLFMNGGWWSYLSLRSRKMHARCCLRLTCNTTDQSRSLPTVAKEMERHSSPLSPSLARSLNPWPLRSCSLSSSLSFINSYLLLVLNWVV